MSLPISFNINLDDFYGPVQNKINKIQAKFNKLLTRTDQRIQDVTRRTKALARVQNINAIRTKRLKKELKSIGGELLALGVTLLAITFPIRQAIAFESAMADVRKVVEFETPDGLQQLSEEIKELSKTIPLTQTQLAQIVAAGGRLGIPAKELKAFATTAAKTAVAFDISAELAGDSLANLSNRLNIPIDRIGEVADAINFLADNTAAKAPALLEILTRVSGQFKTLGIDAAKGAGLAAFAAQLAPTSRLAASSLNIFLKELQKIPGVTEQLVAAPEETIKRVFTALSKIEKVKRIKIIQETFGEAAPFVLSATESLDLYEKTLKLVADETDLLNSINREFAIRSATVGNKLQLLRNRFRNLGLVIGEIFLPFLVVLAAVLGTIGDLLVFIVKITGPLIPVIAGFAGTFILFIAATKIVVALTIAIKLMNLALLRNPFVLMGAAIVSVIILIGTLINKLKLLGFFKKEEDIARQRALQEKRDVQDLAEVQRILSEGNFKVRGSVDTTITVKDQANIVKSIESISAGIARAEGINMLPATP